MELKHMNLKHKWVKQTFLIKETLYKFYTDILTLFT